jgi:tRNA(fMet)-specific endonuclease VapC
MLDTNTCVFIMNGNEAVRNAFIREQPFDLAISAVVLAELQFGVENSARREKNMATLQAFHATVDTLPFDSDAAVEYGRIRAGLQKTGMLIGSLDMLIAAHAKSRGLILVTNNTREFERVAGLKLTDWLG